LIFAASVSERRPTLVTPQGWGTGKNKRTSGGGSKYAAGNGKKFKLNHY